MRTIRAVIVTQLTGGMGNQMFQYAAGRALAARHQAELVLDSSWIDGRGGGVVTETRRYELGCFRLAARLAPLEQVGRLRRSLLPSRRRILSELEEPPFGQLCSALLHAPDDTYLRGYWQNPAYFADSEELLRQDFTFRGSSTAPCPASPLPAVSVHVRRGDYVSDPGVRDRMGTLERDYYHRAIELITSRAGDVRVLLMTDDPDWCETHLGFKVETTLVAATREEGARWSSIMRAMSSCDHHVLANSSFSWWGAWLNPSPTKIVIAPKPWVLDKRWDDAHRIPREWIRIPRNGHHADQPPSTTTFAPVT